MKSNYNIAASILLNLNFLKYNIFTLPNAPPVSLFSTSQFAFLYLLDSIVQPEVFPKTKDFSWIQFCIQQNAAGQKHLCTTVSQLLTPNDVKQTAALHCPGIKNDKKAVFFRTPFPV